MALRGVLNGTSTFVLERLEAGASLEDAIVAAQAAGFAEADPTLDLDGTDASQKLTLLARAALGGDVELDWAARAGVADRPAGAAGPVRLVAELEVTGPGRARARVAPLALAPHDPLARTRGAGVALELAFADGGRWQLEGAGAGRRPTAVAVLADLFDLARRADDLARVAAARPRTA